MFNFSIDFRKLVTDMLPPNHRKSKIIDWVYVLISPIKFLHSLFTEFVDKIRFDLRFNAQVINLEFLLNAKFNGGLNTIYILDANNIPPIYIWTRGENHPLYFRTRAEFQNSRDNFIRRRSEYNINVDFIIMVPSSLNFSKSEMVALINKYNTAGKRYTIKTY